MADVVDALAAVRSASARGEVPPRVEEVLVARGKLTDERAATILSHLRLASTEQVVGGYRVVGRLGAGGMGTVYRARQLSMDRDVALKVFAVSEREKPGEAEKFLREARAVAQLQHPHIVRGLDAGEHGGVRYIAMELLEGETVFQVLRRAGPYPERRALDVVRSVARALEHAWSRGVIHRDVKPSNVFLHRDGRAILFDFGLAKRVVDDPFSSAGLVAQGTPHYASPEQLRGLPDLDVRSDLYSLGATWFHLLTGRVPFPGSSSAAIAARHLTEPFPDPAAGGGSETLRATGRILRRLCAKRREERYPDPTALLLDLDALDQALGRGGEGGTAAALRGLLERLLRGPPPAEDAFEGIPAAEELLRRIEDLQGENARLFCERDLLRHEAVKDEAYLEHLEAENARLSCSRDLLRIEAKGLRAVLDGLRLRREAARRGRGEAPRPAATPAPPASGSAGA